MKKTIEIILDKAPIVLLFLGIVFFAIVTLLRNTSDITLTFNVTGIENTTNSTTLVEVYTKCVEECSHQFYDRHQTLELCYEQCRAIKDINTPQYCDLGELRSKWYDLRGAHTETTNLEAK